MGLKTTNYKVKTGDVLPSAYAIFSDIKKIGGNLYQATFSIYREREDFGKTMPYEEKKHLYSHDLSVNFSIAGSGYVCLRILSNDATPFTKQTLYQYFLNKQAQTTNVYELMTSGRFINTENEGAAISSIYLAAGTILQVSIIYFKDEAGGVPNTTRQLYSSSEDNITSIRDYVTQLL